MNSLTLIASAAVASASLAIAQDAATLEAVPEVTIVHAAAHGDNIVQLAICLDTSGSMRGLIDSARQKIWAVVNDLALATPTPKLSVALLTYGNDGHDAEGGWVKIETDFTDDLDLVSERLFSYTTNGGTELVGRALNVANSLSWSADIDALKLVVIAGNESADQDRKIDFRDACRDTIGRGIMVNAIFCGGENDSDAALWREVAQRADGQYAAIDQNDGTIIVATPYDDELAELSTMLNDTYFAYSAAGQDNWANQATQDDNAAGLSSSAMALRAQTKASGLYRCSWDLVDACQSGQLQVADVEMQQLPEELRSMTEEELAAFVAEKSAERAGIQEKITTVAQQRTAFVSQEMERLALDETRSLDFVIRQAIRAQAATRGFAFASEPVAESTPRDDESDSIEP